MVKFKRAKLKAVGFDESEIFEFKIIMTAKTSIEGTPQNSTIYRCHGGRSYSKVKEKFKGGLKFLQGNLCNQCSS